ncbi:MAG: BatD family protein [Pseudobdellovibrionaceae bacterium]
MFGLKILMFLPLLVMSAAPLQAASGVEVTATVDRNEVGVGDVINLVLSVTAQDSINVERPRLPEIPGLELINESSGMETRSSYTNGQFVTQQSRNFTYMMAVLTPGKLTIPEIHVSVDNKPYVTKKIELQVSNQRSQQRPRGRAQPDPFSMLDDEEELFRQMLQRHFPGQGGPPPGQVTPPTNPNEAFFIQAVVDKNKAYVGEQITVGFWLYTRGQIRDIDTLKYPDLKSFWKEELEMSTRLNFEQAVVNGIAYQRALLVSYALFPIKAGKAKIDPYKAKCTVLTPSTFGFGRPYVFTKASREIEIDVEEVPVQGRPANFTGAVGHFRASAAFEPVTGSTNQPVTLRIRFEGQGNAKLIELPKLELPPSFELYDQKSQAKFMKDGSSFKEFEVLIIPREPGVFNIAPVQMAVFDPDAKKFTVATTQPLNITVTGQGGSAPPPQANAKGTPQPAGPQEPQLPPPADFAGVEGSTTLVSLLFTILLFGSVIIFLGWTAWRKLRTKPKKLSLKLVLNRRMKNIRAMVDKKEFRRAGVEMTNAAYYILGQLSDLGGASRELSTLIEKTPPSLRNELSGQIKDILAQCEALSFAPENMIGDMTSAAKIEALLKQFESVWSKAIELAEI